MNFNTKKPIKVPSEKKTEHPVIKKIASFLSLKKIKKKEFILQAGEINDNIIYVKSGMLRVYLMYEDKQVNTWFVGEDDFFLSMNSFYYNIPTHEYIEALENSEIITISKSTYEMLLKINHNLSLFAIKELYIKLCEYQDQCLTLRFMNAEKKYAFLKENKPEIIEKVSQKHIASFLGIETTYLSKIISNYKV
ncbi:Crp/Fnr family transcriptional regulator [Flavobacterium sp.]|jgi:CRP-like cAMP-binding protein|uniref:Crp/Fnr family transcriptional regulator n=1 Tax=Flavobacterium sp. TaxID=239 RepID=UPI0025F2B5A9|nr:Crp/Fnr family transcriptional regulator [Flavobacterium sp.]